MSEIKGFFKFKSHSSALIEGVTGENLCFRAQQPALKTYLRIPVAVTAVTHRSTDPEAAFRRRRAGGRICCIIRVVIKNSDQSRPVLLTKDTQRASRCHSLKSSVIFILYSAHGDLTAAWFRARESAVLLWHKLKPLSLTDDLWSRLTSCNYVALLKLPDGGPGGWARICWQH